MSDSIDRQAAINMCRISRILNVSMDELMGDDNDSGGRDEHRETD